MQVKLGFLLSLMTSVVFAIPQNLPARSAPGKPSAQCRGRPSVAGRFFLADVTIEELKLLRQAGRKPKVACADPRLITFEHKDTVFTSGDWGQVVVTPNGAIVPTWMLEPEGETLYDRGFYICEDQTVSLGSVDEFWLCPYEELDEESLVHIQELKGGNCRRTKYLAVRCL